MTPPRLPLHLLRGDSPLADGVMAASGPFLLAVRWLAGPIAVGVGGLAVLPGVLLLGSLWLALSRRGTRSTAAPLGEEGLFVLGCALLAAVGSGNSGAFGIVALGMLAAPVLLTVLLALVWASWGHRPTPFLLRRPWFRVLGDNPSAHTVLTRVHVDGALSLELDRGADGPVSAVLYDLRLRPVQKVSWEELRSSYLQGRARVRLEAPPGRYLLSVRAYRPWLTCPPPRFP